MSQRATSLSNAFSIAQDSVNQIHSSCLCVTERDTSTIAINLRYNGKSPCRRDICVGSGAQPALPFGGRGIFMKFHSIVSSYLSNCSTNFSQTVTYNNNVFLPADSKTIVYKHPHSAQRWLIKTELFASLEAESPVSSEISDSHRTRMHRTTFYI